MRMAELDYQLPEDRIAQHPLEPRDSARLMVVDRDQARIEHRVFRELADLLDPGDLLVANDSRVFPARLRGRKANSGGEIELLLLTRSGDRTWRALVKGRTRTGTLLIIGSPASHTVEAEVTGEMPDGVREIRFEVPVDDVLPLIGETPLPPYIKASLPDAERYQTVYSSVTGSAAAPTAGLHFTESLIDNLASEGVGFAFVTLHVGLDTFRPVTAVESSDHLIHREWAHLPESTAVAVRQTRAAGHRVVAVGTTSVRVLESAAAGVPPGRVVEAFEGWTDLFVTPGHSFGAVDAMVTNFHLPRTTLLLLVSAFSGRALMDEAYRAAIAQDYRFYSFGDAMFIR